MFSKDHFQHLEKMISDNSIACQEAIKKYMKETIELLEKSCHEKIEVLEKSHNREIELLKCDIDELRKIIDNDVKVSLSPDKTKNDGCEPFYCNLCCKKFPTQKALSRHNNTKNHKQLEIKINKGA